MIQQRKRNSVVVPSLLTDFWRMVNGEVGMEMRHEDTINMNRERKSGQKEEDTEKAILRQPTLGGEYGNTVSLSLK